MNKVLDGISSAVGVHPALSNFAANAVGANSGIGNFIADTFRYPSTFTYNTFGVPGTLTGNYLVNKIDYLGDKWQDMLGSGRNALMDYLDPYINNASTALQSLSPKSGEKILSSRSGSSGGSMYAPSGVSAAPIYYQAELAQRYGMNRETAYSEAMANTAYQRAVRDMQLAGLNPAVIYGAGRGSSAGSGMVYSSRSGGSGRSGSSQEGNLPDAPGWLYYGAQAAANLIGSLATKNTMIGFALAQLAGTAVKAYNGL